MKIIDIEFVKIPAHSGVYFNEEADRLAKNSILAKGHKTYKDGSVYFVGHTVEDWKEIVDYINSEAEILRKGCGINYYCRKCNQVITKTTISNF